MTGRSAWAQAAGWRRLLPGLLVAILAGCGAQVDVIDGQAIGPIQVVDGQAFRRLEATARGKWAATHAGATPIGYEVHALNKGASDFLMVVTLQGGAHHVVSVHCDPIRFPAADSCS